MIKNYITYHITIGNSYYSFEAPEDLTIEELKALMIVEIPEFTDEQWDSVIVSKRQAINDYGILPDWAKIGTADQAEAYINSQIWNGQSQAQIEAWIDANITNIATANVTQINARLTAIRQGLKLAAGAIIAMRGLFILTAKLLIYIRDLVIRFRRN